MHTSGEQSGVRAGAWRASGIAAALGLLAGIAMRWGSTDFSLDDAYIHLAYAKSLRLGDGLSYNPHDWELGATSPLWVLLLATLPLGASVVPSVQLLGIVLHALTCGLTAATVWCAVMDEASGAAPRARTFGAVAAGGLCALQPLLLQGAVSGMEVPLATATVALTTWLIGRRAHAGWLFVAGLLMVAARPELLVTAGLLAVASVVLGFADWRRDRATWLGAGALLAGAAATMLGWSAYCFARAGHPFPNTYYAKGGATWSANTQFVIERVLTYQPWLVGLGGAVILGWALLRGRDVHARKQIAAWLLSWAGTLLAIAASRGLSADVLFYMQRYFAVIAPLALCAVGLGLVLLPVRARWLLAPVVAVALMMAAQQRASTRAQEASIARLHTSLGALLAERLPADARVVVEGAGASRFFAPRTMTIVDMLGLHDRGIAHAARPMCVVAARAPTHLAVPSEQLALVQRMYRTRPLAVLRDPAFAHFAKVFAREVHVLAIEALQPAFARVCANDLRALEREP